MWDNLARTITDWIREGRIWRVIGTVVGIILAFIYLIWGFWDMLAFLIIVIAGYTLGLKSDNREKWFNIDAFSRWFHDKWYR
jgi:uncharacterized membrane protein